MELVAFGQVPDELRPSEGTEYDLTTSKSLLQYQAGFNATLKLEKGISEYKGTGRYALGYERRLKRNILNNWWSFKADTRIHEFSPGKIESRMLLTHGRELNDFIKLRSNWGFGYGPGLYPTYMMGLSFDLAKQWRLVSPGRPLFPKVNTKVKTKNQIRPE